MGGFNPIKAITKVITKVVDVVVDIVEAVVDIVGSVTSALFGWLTPSIPSYDSPAGFEAYNQGTMVNKQSNVAHLPVIYGKKRAGGIRVFVTTAGAENKFLYVCLAVCEGEIDGFEKIYINDEEVPMDSLIHGVERTPTSGRFKDRMKIQCFKGLEDQIASTLLKEAPGWTDHHTLRGVAYIAARFEWKKATQQELENQTNSNPFSSVPTIQALVHGRKVVLMESIDPATYSGTFHSGTSFSQNPVNCLADYLRNDRFGKGISNDRIDFASFKAAAEVCNESKSFADGSAAFLKCDINLDTGQKMFDNTKALMECARAYLPYQAGKYGCFIETGISDTSNLFVIDDDKIIGEIAVSGEDKTTKFNKCELTFSNADKDYESDVVIFENSTYLTEDSGEELKKTHSSPGITTRKRAFDQARLIVDRSRKQKQVSVTCTAETQDLVPGDIVKLTHKLVEHPSSDSDYMFNETLFRVLGIEQNIDQSCRLVLIEHDNTIYDVQQAGPDHDLNAIEYVNPYLPDDDEDEQSGGSDYTGPGTNLTATITDRVQKGVGRAVYFSYSGLNVLQTRFTVKDSFGSNVKVYDLNAYPPSNTNQFLCYVREPGQHTVTVLGRHQVTQRETQLATAQITVTHDDIYGTSSVTTSSAAQGGFA